MSVEIKYNDYYQGKDVARIVNKNTERCLNGYRIQIRHSDNLKGSTVIEMFNNLEKLLRLELE